MYGFNQRNTASSYLIGFNVMAGYSSTVVAIMSALFPHKSHPNCWSQLLINGASQSSFNLMAAFITVVGIKTKNTPEVLTLTFNCIASAQQSSLECSYQPIFVLITNPLELTRIFLVWSFSHLEWILVGKSNGWLEVIPWLSQLW